MDNASRRAKLGVLSSPGATHLRGCHVTRFDTSTGYFTKDGNGTQNNRHLIWAQNLVGRYLVCPRTGNVDALRPARFGRDSGLSFERTAVGSWIAIGVAEEVAAKCWGTTDVRRRWRGGNGNGRQLRVSLWSDVVQLRTARRRQGTAQGYELCGSGHESTGLGHVGKRRTSLEGFGKTDANRFSRDPRGKPMWMRSCAICKALLHKLQLRESVRCQCGWVW
jgi:hypothetical protein